MSEGMTPTSNLKIGDVVMSPDFVYCDPLHYENIPNNASDVAGVESRGVKNGMVIYKGVTKWLFTRGTGFKPRKSNHRVDQSRKDAKYVVVFKFRHNSYNVPGTPIASPQQYDEIILQKLRKNGTYNINGEKLFISSTSGIVHFLPEVQLVGKMKMTFIPVE